MRIEQKAPGARLFRVAGLQQIFPTMNPISRQLKSPLQLGINSELIVCTKDVEFVIRANGDAIILSGQALRAFLQFRGTCKRSTLLSLLQAADKFMRHAGLSLCWKRARFAILGVNAHPIFLSLMSALIRLGKN